MVKVIVRLNFYHKVESCLHQRFNDFGVVLHQTYTPNVRTIKPFDCLETLKQHVFKM